MIRNLLLCAAVSVGSIGSLQARGIENLRCEYSRNPINVDVQQPRFTWIYDDFIPEKVLVRLAASPNELEAGPLWQTEVMASQLPLKYDGAYQLKPHTTYYWHVTATDGNGKKVVSNTASFTTAKYNESDWMARMITDGNDKECEAAPMFRKTFVVPSDIKTARIYVTSAGYNEIKINGKRIDDTHMNPGYTHFDKRLLYDVVDVTSLLKPGKNVITAVLGNGFYNCQSKAVWDFEIARWRNRPGLMCEILGWDSDGNTRCIVTTDSSWLTATGPYTYNNIYSGDRYDARLGDADWTDAGYDDSSWTRAKEIQLPAEILCAQTSEPIRPTEIINPVLLKSWGDTVFVFDMGKNIAGVTSLRLKGENGTHLCISHGELLDDTGRIQQGNINVYYRPEKPGEKFQTDEFTLKGSGREEEFTPMFTYHGFRYAEVVSDRPVKLSAKNVKGLKIHTDLRRVGSFECSNPLLNKIYDATMLSYVDNIHSIPTDCPQREKNGWTADAHAAIDLALINYDGIKFYEKWMNDFIDNQRPDGNIAGIIPSSGWGYGDWPGPVWDAALFIIPEALYNYYGDKEVIERLYPTMERYFKWAKAHENEHGLTVNGIGDWLSSGAQTSTEYTSSVYYYLDNVKMSHFAGILGRDGRKYKDKADSIKAEINKIYFNGNTNIYDSGSQTAQAVALYAGIVPSGHEQQVADILNESVVNNSYHLDFGLLGSKTVLRMLTKYGYIDTAYKMATQTTAPSWGYWIADRGYTTLPETWTLSPEFHDASLNHVFFGDISAWMTNTLAGIKSDEANPGFKHFTIAPEFVPGLDYVRAEYDSVKGKIRSYWQRKGDYIILEVDIPYGTEATVVTDKTYNLTGGHHTIKFNKIS